MNCYFITDDDKLIGPFKLKAMTVVSKKSIQNENKMKDKILNTVSDLVTNFVYYDRREDETLNSEQLYQAIRKGVVSIDEITSRFRNELISAINE